MLPLLEISSRLPWRVRLHMIIKLLARELALANFLLVFVRRDAVFFDAIAMAVFNGLGDIGSVGGFVAMPWFDGIIRILVFMRRIQGGPRGGSGGRRGSGVIEGCGA